MRAGRCLNPCSTCDVKALQMSSPAALNAQERGVVASLQRQLEAFSLLRSGCRRKRRLLLENIDSSTGYAPSLAGMVRLSTAPYVVYRIVGFDLLNVRFTDAVSFLHV